MTELKIHEIRPLNDHRLVINNREAILLGGETNVNVYTGVAVDGEEIIHDDEKDYNYKRQKIEAQLLYDRSKQVRSGWFAIDLETGSRPQGGWFPGKR